MFKQRVKTHVLEKVVAFFMILFGVSSIYIFVQAYSQIKATGEALSPIVALIEIMILVLIAVFANIWITIKIYEQHRP